MARPLASRGGPTLLGPPLCFQGEADGPLRNLHRRGVPLRRRRQLCGYGPARGNVDIDGLIASEFFAKPASESCGLPLLRTYWYDGAKDGIPTADHQRIAALPNLKLRLGRIEARDRIDTAEVMSGISLTHPAPAVTSRWIPMTNPLAHWCGSGSSARCSTFWSPAPFCSPTSWGRACTPRWFVSCCGCSRTGTETHDAPRSSSTPTTRGCWAKEQVTDCSEETRSGSRRRRATAPPGSGR